MAATFPQGCILAVGDVAEPHLEAGSLSSWSSSRSTNRKKNLLDFFTNMIIHTRIVNYRCRYFNKVSMKKMKQVFSPTNH